MLKLLYCLIEKLLVFIIFCLFKSSCVKQNSYGRGESAVLCKNHDLWTSEDNDNTRVSRSNVWSLAKIDLNRYQHYDSNVSSDSMLATLFKLTNRIKSTFRACMNQKQQGTGYEGVFCSCEEMRREQTGAIGVFCSNDQLWHSNTHREINSHWRNVKIDLVSKSSELAIPTDFKVPFLLFILGFLSITFS
ncbi:hypothetical protein KSF78_0000594 [Schistosoma japonicum]|nr:hypothetical protein KSF78_0000594 [Schistosoma japonicum]